MAGTAKSAGNASRKAIGPRAPMSMGSRESGTNDSSLETWESAAISALGNLEASPEACELINYNGLTQILVPPATVVLRGFLARLSRTL